MTEYAPKILSAESVRLKFDPSDQVRAALAGFYNEKYVERAQTATLGSVATFGFCHLDNGDVSRLPDSDILPGEDITTLRQRMGVYATQLRYVEQHQMPLASSFRIEANKRGDLRLYFRALPTGHDKQILDSLAEMRLPHDGSVELFAHIHPLQAPTSRDAIVRARDHMVDVLGIGQAHRAGVPSYRAERTPTDISKKLFVTDARLHRDIVPIGLPRQPHGPIAS